MPALYKTTLKSWYRKKQKAQGTRSKVQEKKPNTNTNYKSQLYFSAMSLTNSNDTAIASKQFYY